MDRELTELVEKAKIADVLHRWCRGVDRADAELAKSAYHHDGTDDHGIFKGLGWDFVDLAITIMKGNGITSHYLSNIIIEIRDDIAYSESYVLYFQSTVPNEDGSFSDIVIGGRYIDRFEKRKGEWRIADRKSIFDWTQTLPSTGKWDGIPHSLYKPRGTQDTTDWSYTSPLFANQDEARPVYTDSL